MPVEKQQKYISIKEWDIQKEREIWHCFSMCEKCGGISAEKVKVKVMEQVRRGQTSCRPNSRVRHFDRWIMKWWADNVRRSWGWGQAWQPFETPSTDTWNESGLSVLVLHLARLPAIDRLIEKDNGVVIYGWIQRIREKSDINKQLRWLVGVLVCSRQKVVMANVAGGRPGCWFNCLLVFYGLGNVNSD